MKFRSRVLVAVAATAVLGLVAAVAAVPASAKSATIICMNSSPGTCINSNVDPVGLTTGVPPGFAYPFGMCTTYEGNSYCEVRQSGTETCLGWDDSGNNFVRPASCNRNSDAELWWWSGLRFRNLAATKAGEHACMNADTSASAVDVYLCNVTSSEWGL
jgi:hypothetical protein